LGNIAENCDHNIDPDEFVKKIAQNGSLPMFRQNKFVTFTVGKSSPDF
jgi:putative ribosome biogenesis GTPase RsgA